MINRVLPLEGINNFRDYGNYASSLGGRVKAGLLWRSAQHGDASAADLAKVDELALATVIDLRGPSEREDKPCRRPKGFSAQVFTYPEETAGLALHTEAADGVLTAAEARGAMLRLYQGIAYRPNLVPMLRLYLQVLQRGEGPNLVHCVAGKDRTGFAAALFQHLLGVHADDVMQDYLLTNQANKLDERIAAGSFREMPPYAALGEAAVRALWGVEEAYLAAALTAIAASHGTIDAYLEQVLGVDAEMRDQLRRLYLET